MHVAAVGVGGISKLFVSDYWLHWITVCSFLLIGIILIYMGITEEEEHEEFDEKLKNIEVEMMSKRSIIMSEELAEELNKSDADPNDPENVPKSISQALQELYSFYSLGLLRDEQVKQSLGLLGAFLKANEQMAIEERLLTVETLLAQETLRQPKTRI